MINILMNSYLRIKQESIFLNCKKNLEILFWGLKEMIHRLQPKLIEVFVTEGYDCNFMRKCMILEDMETDIQRQVLTSFSIESYIYQIKV